MSHQVVLLATLTRSLPTESNTDLQPGENVPILHSVLDRESVFFRKFARGIFPDSMDDGYRLQMIQNRSIIV
jgi:hypothetical protein